MKIVFLLSILTISLPAMANPMVVATLPEIQWLVKEIGGDKVEAIALLNGNEDPHFVDATPSFILKVSNADLVVANGLDLEIGWLPKVIQMAGNRKVQFAGKGYCDASKEVSKEQMVKNYNRSMGDLHPKGNPHYTLSPSQMVLAGKTITECLSNLAPKDAKKFSSNYEAVKKKLEDLQKKLTEKLRPLEDKKFMTYHQEFTYFFKDFDLNSSGTLEKIPGVLPSATQLFAVAKVAKESKVALVLASTTNPRKYLEKFKEITGIKYVQLPLHMSDGLKGYLDFLDNVTSEILKHAKSQ